MTDEELAELDRELAKPDPSHFTAYWRNAGGRLLSALREARAELDLLKNHARSLKSEQAAMKTGWALGLEDAAKLVRNEPAWCEGCSYHVRRQMDGPYLHDAIRNLAKEWK